jgi:hypothetical protein
MPSQTPFRLPCEAVAGKPRFFWGGPFAHGTSPVLVDKYVNTTTVPSPVDGSPIPPFERWTPDPSGGGSCEVHHCSTGEFDAPCAAWTRPYPVNTFAHTPGDQVNFAVAKKRGFKNAAACRFWSGVPGYGVARDGGLDTTQCCGDGTIKKWNGARLTIESTKFLTVAISSENILTDYHYDGSGNLTGTTVAFDDTSAVSQSIDPNSGLLSFSGFAVNPNSSANHSLAQLAFAFWTPSQIVEKATTPFLDGTPFSTVECTDNSITVKDSDGRIIETLTWDFAAGIANHKTYEYSGTGAQFLDEEITISFSDAGLFYSDTVNTWSSFGGADLELAAKQVITMNATLGGANTSASILADIVAMLALWPLNDNALYPFRTDTKVSVAPLVSRDEVQTTAFTADFYTVNGDGTLSLNTADTRVATGDIIGAPLPAGYQSSFNFAYEDWTGCCDVPGDGSRNWAWYQLGWGMTVGTFNNAASCSLPLNCTQWTNYFQAVNKPQGASLIYNEPGTAFYPGDCVSSSAPSGTLDGGKLWGYKYAEILDAWPSQNFARPAGDEKFAFDETRVYCATIVDAMHFTLTDPLTGLAPADGTDFSGIWGGAVASGFYSGNTYSGGTITLGTKVYDLPSNWASRSNSDENYCFGKLRWPTVPALLGRIAITPDVAGTTMTFAAAQPAFGMTTATHQEQVDLYDATMTLLASNVTATRVNDSSFSLPTAHSTAAFVLINGVKWYMNDSDPKGDLALLQWWSDFRTKGEYDRLTGVLDCGGGQVARPTANAGGGPVGVATEFAVFTQTPGCIPFSPCAPKVVCISPNGETFPNGITYPFPDTFACDDQYGSKWWAWVQVTMTDLLWQPPHRPCNIGPTDQWKEDGGTCAENTGGSPATYYYPHRPQVEARLTVPCNYGAAQHECAPALPSGIQIGWLSPVDHDTGDVALPPVPPGALSDGGRPASANTAWDLHSLFCTSAAAGCGFDYTLPGC